MKPNIFNYATSELSQDAFFCWLLEWANSIYDGEKMNRISMKFINFIFDLAHFKPLTNVKKIHIKQQIRISNNRRIDFYAIINNEYVILFEDKVFSGEHDNQLTAYKEYSEKHFTDKKIISVYIKSDIVFSDERIFINDNGYLLIDIYTLIDLLEEIDINEVYNEYVIYLHERKDNYVSFLTNTVETWTNENWFGFIHYLNNYLDGSQFGKHYKGDDTWWLILSMKEDNKECYGVELQINSRDCIIKTSFEEADTRNDKLQYKELLIKDLKVYLKDYNIRPTGSYGGKNMIVAYIDGYMAMENGLINLDKTLENLRDITNKFNQYYDNL